MTIAATLGSYSSWTTIGDYRADAEYYRPEHREFFDSLTRVPHRRLGQIAKMRRPQYRTTSAYDPGKLTNGIKFLSPTEVVNQWVDWSIVREVVSSAWEDYPAGRATKGDLLLEVKGDATKVYLLGDNIPAKTMISGSFQQIRLKVEHEEWYVYAVFLSGVWRRQRQRLQSNINIKYVDKEALLTVVLPWPDNAIRASIGHKVRAAERLRAVATSNVSKAVSRIEGLLGTTDFSALKPNPDGSCDYFSEFVSVSDLSLFHGAQFYAPKRKRAVALIKATGIAERLGTHGHRIRAKGKQKANRGHVDPANVSGSDGYWYAGGTADGGDVVLAKPGHTLFLRMRPYLNKTTINDSAQVVSGSPEFLVYEFDGLDAYFATLCLRQPWALAQVAEIATGDRPRVDGEFVDEVMVPWPDESVRHEIGQLYKSSFALRRRADQLVQQAIADVENLIDGKLDEDQCLAEGRKLAEEFGLEVP